MNKGEIIRFLILRTIGNFLLLFAIFGVLATFGPSLYYEIYFKVSQLRGINYAVADEETPFGELLRKSKEAQTGGALGALLTGPKEQILIPKDTEFSILIPKIGASTKVFPNIDPSNQNEFLPILQRGVAHAKGTVFPGMQGGPHNHQTAAIAVALGEILKPSFKKYAAQIVKNAKALADSLTKEGMTLVSGGTDNHLMLIDLRNLKIAGKEASHLLDEAGLTVNKNMIPGDPGTPFNPSGIRLGTPAITSRGMKEKEMKKIGKIIAVLLKNPSSPAILKEAKKQVLKITKRFPVPGIR